MRTSHRIPRLPSFYPRLRLHISYELYQNPICIEKVSLNICLITFVLESIFALVYLRTGNLFVAMGVHVLSNDPTSLFLTQPITRVVVGLCVLILLLGWLWSHRLRMMPNEDANTPTQ